MLGKQHNGQKRIMNTIIIRVPSITKHGSIVMGHAMEDGTLVPYTEIIGYLIKRESKLLILRIMIVV